jgi:AraC family transcriptional regulator
VRSSHFGGNVYGLTRELRRSQVLLRHSLSQNIAEPLEPESLALTKVQRAVGPRTTHTTGGSIGRQRLVDRVKLVLASDLARRWTLGEIDAEVRGSAVYLTHVFQQAEGLPLYRYRWRELLTFWRTMTA